MSKKTRKETKIAYRVIEIKNLKFSVNAEDNLDFDKIDVDGTVKYFMTEMLEGRAEFSFDVITTVVSRLTGNKIIEHSGRTRFEVVNLKNSDSKTNGVSEDVKIPNQLIASMYGLSHSHARALLAVSLQNTDYQDKFFIPIVDPNLILESENNITIKDTDT
ncbi:hypothetical protein [Sphingobacterium hungaricum]|uniref:Uncharacterized protein n=1 Tax=Sphingobacterium hungaricum TaxID=2082723 RepID=A0A928YRT3_9SPHI|nr:hypothetical protein [Sphingobacterium hungaricum]MBE8715289.1 hypothetical protein [Sphingobacterium hungaricum]